jgi:hypothetical protein
LFQWVKPSYLERGYSVPDLFYYLYMSTPNQKQQRLQIIFLALIGITIPCYALGYTFVNMKRKNEPTPTARIPATATITLAPIITNTPEPIIPTRFPTFTPTITPTVTPTRTETPTPTVTYTPTPTPTDTYTPTATATNTQTQPATTEPPPLPTATEE